MEKVEIARELLKNTTNKFIKIFIKEYIDILETNSIKKCSNNMLLKFDKCISFIKDACFDINGWMLFEIPIEYAYCFWNEETKKAFDLDIFEVNGEVIPTYLDNKSNEQSAITIDEAIEKYYNADYIKAGR